MTAITTSSAVTAGDRLSLTLFFAIVLHGILILGVSFSAPERKPLRSRTLEITLVQRRAEKAPEKPDYLAQANQQGEGTIEEPARPSSPLASPLTDNVVKPTPAPSQPPPASEPPQTAEEVIATQAPAPHHVPEDSNMWNRQPKTPPVAARLISRSLEIASLSAQIERSLQAYAKRPRRRFITASTQEASYAMYLEAWRRKVERIGNLNYPEKAKQKRLSGNLRLEVALNPDGTVNDIILNDSSGHKILDDAAMRIVHLAAPFSPFSKDMRKETDILHIIRTWEFLSSSRLHTR